MKKTKPLVVALALGLIAAGSALGQTLVCTERVSQDTGLNWYAGEGHTFMIGGQNRLAYDPNIRSQPGGTYPVIYYELSVSGDSLSGVGEFSFPPQADGVEVQVHYQEAGGNWTAGTTTATPSGQISRCPKMFVQDGSMTSFVVRVAVADRVPDGTPINAVLKNITGLTGVSTGRTPFALITTKTGPWSMKWWKKPTMKIGQEFDGVVLRFTIAAPPALWVANKWSLQETTDLQVWRNVAPTLVVPEGGDNWFLIRNYRVLAGPPSHKFFRLQASY